LVTGALGKALAATPFFAAMASALLFRATALSGGWLIFMVFSKTTVYVAS
jgi:hypothetical protein